MMQQISIYLTSIILGIMLFFSFVVAPVTFTALNEENARKFIRKIFPYYYIVNLAISVLVLILFIILKIFSLDFYLILSVTVLDEENSRKFIRKIFPYYYNVNLVISFLVLIFFVIQKTFSLNFYLILTVAILFVLSNYILMPLINKYKDENQDKKFKYSHFISVVINFIQMILLVIILI